MALQNINNKQATTTLDGGINDSVTALTAIDDASTAGFPAAPFPVLIDTELVNVTSTGTGKNWTIERGYGGTTAATHSTTADVVFKVTAEWFNDVAGSIPLLWTKIVDDDLSTLTDVTTYSGTWSIAGGVLECSNTSMLHCRAVHDTTYITRVVIIEVEAQIPSSGFTTSNHHFGVASGRGDVAGGMSFRIRGDGNAYMEREAQAGIATAAYSLPTAGTWVKIRMIQTYAGTVCGYLDGVKYLTTANSSGLSSPFKPHLVVWSTGATGSLVVNFRNMKVWTGDEIYPT